MLLDKKQLDKFLNEQLNVVKKKKYTIELGVYADSKQRAKDNILNTDNSLTNAQLMYLHEYGSIRYPARPVLHLGIEYAKQNIIPETVSYILEKSLKDDWIEQDVDKELEKMCFKIRDYTRDIIHNKDSRLVPNTELTAKRKGGNYPLHDTGQLERSIECRLLK